MESLTGTTPSQKVKRFCIVCGTNATQFCSACKIFFYCNKEHQSQHWRDGRHKERCNKIPVKNWDVLRDQIASLLLQGDTLQQCQLTYQGKREIGKDKLVWFFKPLQRETPVFQGNIVDYFTGSQRMQSMDEVGLFYFTGKCSLVAYGAALATLCALQEMEFQLDGLMVRRVLVGHLLVTRPFKYNVFCYEKKVPPEKDDRNLDKWDCDHLHTKNHQVLILELEDLSWKVIDFAAAQYGIFTKIPSGKGFIHVETVKAGQVKPRIESESAEIEISYGNLLECSSFQDDYQLKRSLDSLDMRTNLIKDLGLLACENFKQSIQPKETTMKT